MSDEKQDQEIMTSEVMVGGRPVQVQEVRGKFSFPDGEKIIAAYDALAARAPEDTIPMLAEQIGERIFVFMSHEDVHRLLTMGQPETPPKPKTSRPIQREGKKKRRK